MTKSATKKGILLGQVLRRYGRAKDETIRSRAVRGLLLQLGKTFAAAAADMGVAPPTLQSGLMTEKPNPKTLDRIRSWLTGNGVTGPKGRPLENADLLS